MDSIRIEILNPKARKLLKNLAELKLIKSMKGFDKLIFSDKAVLLFSDELMTEFIDVTSREKLKPYFTKEDINKNGTTCNTRCYIKHR